ncbi:unnamed protein product [Schistosoma turkestanicum]|nr:unnamed protein product [Schistosoma turkestanicum]
MKFILALSLLTFIITLVSVEARYKADEVLLRRMALETVEKLKLLTLQHMRTFRNHVQEYFKQDDLGEKIAQVLTILIKRLNRRLEKCLNSKEE